MTKIKRYKQTIRRFMQSQYTDERLAQLLAHAQEDKLSYYSCCCFIGVATATHALKAQLDIPPSFEPHYRAAGKLPGADDAESAYAQIGSLNRMSDESHDAIRRRILIPMIKAEMKRRSHARQEITAKSQSENLKRETELAFGA